MGCQANELMQVEAELHAPMGSVQLTRYCFAGPVDNLTRKDDGYRLDLCLSPRPRNSRACYPDHWNERRFERIGNMFLLPAGETMRARSDGCCEQTSLVCQLYPEAMKAWFDGDLVWTDCRLMAGLDIRDANIQHLLFRLHQEARQPGFASDMLVELVVAQLAIELTRYCTGIGTTAKTGGLSSWRLRLIDERLQELGLAPTLAELADLCRLSVRQMTRGFRASRGSSIGDYVANSRVEQAKQLLTSDQSVKSIAYTLGFSSPSSFCYAFRRDTGETPGQYRQRLLSTH